MINSVDYIKKYIISLYRKSKIYLYIFILHYKLLAFLLIALLCHLCS